MAIYSKRISFFLCEIKRLVVNILTKEAGLEVKKDYFYDFTQEKLYPIHVVVYNDRSHIGYFDSDFYEMGFHEKLLRSDHTTLLRVIRHEIAHYLTFIQYGRVSAHGNEFHLTCRRLGWGKEISSAQICLEEIPQSDREAQAPIVRKIQKLLALSESKNAHEAGEAMVKAHQLLMKHKIEAGDIEQEDPYFVSKRIMRYKRISAKTTAIARILQTLFINVVYHRHDPYTYIEISGQKTHVEVAEYIACTLNRELDTLWEKARIEQGLHSTVEKNSFFYGIAKGYCDKVNTLVQSSPQNSRALIAMQNQLSELLKMIYPSVSRKCSKRQICAHASRIGQENGRNLQIKSGISSSLQKNLLLE